MATLTLSEVLNKTGLNDLFASPSNLPKMREGIRHFLKLVEPAAPGVASIEDVELAGGDGPRMARLYTPYEAMDDAVLLFFHGGGFMVGDVPSYDPLCQRLAAASGVRVVSYDYRLAPEHPFPAALEDVLAAFDDLKAGALSDHGLTSPRIAVGGDSAGGNLSAVIAHERRGEVQFQLLIYPLMQLVERTRKSGRWQESPILTEPALANIQKSYVTEDHELSDPRISPLLQNDLSRVAPAFILSAELDSLNAEGRAYADKLSAFGVPVERVVINGVSHGFIQMGRIMSKAKDAAEMCGKALSKALSA